MWNVKSWRDYIFVLNNKYAVSTKRPLFFLQLCENNNLKHTNNKQQQKWRVGLETRQWRGSVVFCHSHSRVMSHGTMTTGLKRVHLLFVRTGLLPKMSNMKIWAVSLLAYWCKLNQLYLRSISYGQSVKHRCCGTCDWNWTHLIIVMSY